MSNNQMVSVPRDLLERCCMRPRLETQAVNHQDIIDRGRAQSEVRELLTQPAEQHHGEPVAFVEVTGSRPTKYCWMGATRILPVGLHKLYTRADPAEVGEIKKHNAELLVEVDTLTAEVERLETLVGEIQALRLDSEAKLAERDALLREVRETLQKEYWDQYAGLDETRDLINAALERKP